MVIKNYRGCFEDNVFLVFFKTQKKAKEYYYWSAEQSLQAAQDTAREIDKRGDYPVIIYSSVFKIMVNRREIKLCLKEQLRKR